MDWSYPLLCACERGGDRVAVVSREEPPITYRQLEERIARLSAGLRTLLAPGDPVAWLLPNVPAAIEVSMALARVGAVGVPVNTRLAPEEVAYIVGDAGARTAIAAADSLPLARRLREDGILDLVIPLDAEAGGGPSVAALRESDPEPPPLAGDRDEEEAATITYTSGTTGFPKGVVRSHRANAWNVVNSALGSPRRPRDVELFNLPIFGIGYLHFALPALLGGATIVLDGGFDAARAWELLERHRVTRTFLAPTMVHAMLEVPGQAERDLASLEMIYTAYAFPERLRAAALARFGDLFVNMYGLTEAQLTCVESVEVPFDGVNVGRAMGVSRIAVLDEDGKTAEPGATGEIAFEGPSLMSRYHRDPAATEAALPDGWLRTGDLGRIEADGELRYAGRIKDMIKTGGFSVDPVEVENAVLTLEEVEEAAVVGAPDERWGEAVVAFVAPRRGAAIDVERVLGACRERIASFKVPKRVLVVEELPKNATGKIDKGSLRRSLHG